MHADAVAGTIITMNMSTDADADALTIITMNMHRRIRTKMIPNWLFTKKTVRMS